LHRNKACLSLSEPEAEGVVARVFTSEEAVRNAYTALCNAAALTGWGTFLNWLFRSGLQGVSDQTH